MRAFLSCLVLLLAACSSEHPPAGGAARDGDVTSYAKTLIGTPYRYGGESPSTGFDCSGFVRHVYHHSRGVWLPHRTSDLARVGKPVGASDLRPGDLVFYNTLGPAHSHVGIYLGNDRFIHAPSTGKHVEIVDMSINYWRKRYDGARRVMQYR